MKENNISLMSIIIARRHAGVGNHLAPFIWLSASILHRCLHVLRRRRTGAAPASAARGSALGGGVRGYAGRVGANSTGAQSFGEKLSAACRLRLSTPSAANGMTRGT